MRTGNRDDADCISVPITRHNIFDGDSHPGYDQFALLDLIEFFAENVHDVVVGEYLITDRYTGKLYVGSATSDNGMLLQR